MILFIISDHLSGGIEEQPIRYLSRAVSRPGKGAVTDVMNAAAFLSIFIFLNVAVQKHFILPDVNPYIRILMYLFL